MTWEWHVCVAFLAFSLLSYALLGGADFGAGVVEIVLRGPRHAAARRAIEKTIGPVWEANHIWLILAVVILFMGFPPAYAALSVSLHLPVTAALLGVVARGTSFTFRHYDAVRDGARPWYNWVFRLSSLWTPFWFGVTLAGLSAGRAEVSATDFYAGYVAPWLHPYGLLVGAFTVALFAFLASVYLIGESRDVAVRTAFARRARAFLFTAMPLGASVFAAAQFQGLPLLARFFGNPLAMACVLASATSLIVLENGLRLAARPETVMRRRIPWGLRLLAGAQGTAIVSAWFLVHYPVLFAYRDGTAITLVSAASPQATLRVLTWALLAGALLILPALGWLYRIFNGPVRPG